MCARILPLHYTYQISFRTCTIANSRSLVLTHTNLARFVDYEQGSRFNFSVTEPRLNYFYYLPSYPASTIPPHTYYIPLGELIPPPILRMALQKSISIIYIHDLRIYMYRLEKTLESILDKWAATATATNVVSFERFFFFLFISLNLHTYRIHNKRQGSRQCRCIYAHIYVYIKICVK